MINYNHLYYFWVIAKEGGVTAACKKLRLSQPTVSAQLAQFEEFIGTPLFERKSRKLILNDKGKIVFDHAQVIFKKSEEMMTALQDSSVKDVVKLKVGITSSLPKKNVHSVLKRALSHSKVTLTLIEKEMSFLLESLKNNEIDFILSLEPAPKDMRGFYDHVLEKLSVIFVASPDYKTLRRKFPLSLQEQNLYLPTIPKILRETLEDYFAKNNVNPKIMGDVQDIEMLRVIAVGGHGVVAIPRSSVSDLLKAKELYIIGDNIDAYLKLYLITNEKKVSHPIVVEMLK